MGRVQLRRRHHHQRTAGEGTTSTRRSTSRSSTSKSARRSSAAKSSPATFRTSARRPFAISTRPASSASERSCRPGDILVGKVSPKAKTRADAGRKAAHAIFGKRRRRREERIPRSPVGRRRHRHPHRRSSRARMSLDGRRAQEVRHGPQEGRDAGQRQVAEAFLAFVERAGARSSAST